jgi:hypothetical protein
VTAPLESGAQWENIVEPGLNWEDILQDDDSQLDEDWDSELESEQESKLIISEVFYDGKDVPIEIYNIWDGAFYGDIELSW